MSTTRRSTATVRLWGTHVATVTWDPERELGFFEYEPDFLDSAVEIAPLHMPLASTVYSFAGLARPTFHGLPGLLADSLPDRFGNALIDAWLASHGRTPDSFDPVERLCYVGRRGMGALEFEPRLGFEERASTPLDVGSLVELANQVLDDRERFATRLRETRPDDEAAEAMRAILRVGTSAGGARAKAVIGWNEATGEVRSGQLDLPDGFGHWLLKFDGVTGNRDRELTDPLGYGRIEYAYHLMAVAAGIEMRECRLLEESGRAHFMTRRFDRIDGRGMAGKMHMQTLGAIDHLDFNLPGANSYEQALLVARRLDLAMEAREELVRRALFNLCARNQDDHVKNLAFLMDRTGTWSLAPAYDITYAYNPDGMWTGRHQMSLGGKRDGFTREDVRSFGTAVGLRRGGAEELLEAVEAATARWHEFAERAAVPERDAERIGRTHRTLA